MNEAPKPEKKWLKQLTNKYRLVVINDETFEEVSSFRLSRMNVYVLVSTLIVIFSLIVASAIVFTPLKEYVPGYSDVGMKREFVVLRMRADSLQMVMDANDKLLADMKTIINGGVPLNRDTTTATVPSEGLYDSIPLQGASNNEKDLRESVDKSQNFTLNIVPGKPKPSNNLSGFYFFTPLKGFVTAPFEPKKEHYGVDIVAPENSPIKSTLDGVVIMSSYTAETGYVIGIQHNNNLISLYKHCSVLLKKQGDFVNAGDVIAIVGNSGEQTTGPHLHFELWYNGNAINPEDYLVFN